MRRSDKSKALARTGNSSLYLKENLFFDREAQLSSKHTGIHTFVFRCDGHRLPFVCVCVRAYMNLKDCVLTKLILTRSLSPSMVLGGVPFPKCPERHLEALRLHPLQEGVSLRFALLQS